MAKTNTFREHLQGAILETCDLWDTWSEWWGDRTWPKKRQWQIQRQWQRQIHLESTFKERSLGLVTFDTRHLSWVMRRQDLTKKLIMTKTNTKTKTMTKKNTSREHLRRATLDTCDLWDFWSEWLGDMTWPTTKIPSEMEVALHYKLLTLLTLLTWFTLFILFKLLYTVLP